jgi:hypothetical protein
LGLTLEQVAALVKSDDTTLSLVERGRQAPRP